MTDTLEVAVNPALTLEEVVANPVLMMDLAPKEVPKGVTVVIPRDIRAAVPAKEAGRVPVSPALMMALEKEADLMGVERDPAKVHMMDTLEVEMEEVAIPMMATEVVSCLLTTRNTMEMEAARDPMMDTLEVAVNPALTLEEEVEVASLVLMMDLAPKEVPKGVTAVIPRDIRAVVPEKEAAKARNLDHMMALEKEADLMEVERDLVRVHMMDTLEVATEVVMAEEM